MRAVHTGESLWKIQNEKVREQTIKKSLVGKESGKGKKLGTGDSVLSNGFKAPFLAAAV